VAWRQNAHSGSERNLRKGGGMAGLDKRFLFDEDDGSYAKNKREPGRIRGNQECATELIVRL